LLALNEVSEPQGAPTSLPVEHSEADAAEKHALVDLVEHFGGNDAPDQVILFNDPTMG